MSLALIESLSVPQRLALAYAPAQAKGPVLALFALDARLGQAIRQASEPIMGQVRLAWWRDQLSAAPAERENSDDLVAALAALEGEGDALLALVDAWEVLLSERLDEAALGAFASGRAGGFVALARLLGADASGEGAARAGRRFALADLAANLGDAEERQAVLAAAGSEGLGHIALPRSLRSLSVLDGLARRSIARAGAPLMDGPGSAFAAIRLGLLGR